MVLQELPAMGIESGNRPEYHSVPSERDELCEELSRAWSPGIPHDGEGNVTDVPPSWDEATETWRQAWEVNVYGYRATHTDGRGNVTECELRGGRLYAKDGNEADLELLKDLIRVLRGASE
jgi:hypothetical protein